MVRRAKGYTIQDESRMKIEIDLITYQPNLPLIELVDPEPETRSTASNPRLTAAGAKPVATSKTSHAKALRAATTMRIKLRIAGPPVGAVGSARLLWTRALTRPRTQADLDKQTEFCWRQSCSSLVVLRLSNWLWPLVTNSAYEDLMMTGCSKCDSLMTGHRGHRLSPDTIPAPYNRRRSQSRREKVPEYIGNGANDMRMLAQ
jgi:hypothetical protein